MDDLIACLKSSSSAVISVCALFLTSYQVWATRKHNKLSVQPRLTTYRHIERDVADEKVIRVFAGLRNSGLGPAYIQSFEILVNDVPFLITETEDFYKLINQSLTATLVQSRIEVLRKNHVLSKDEKADLIDLKILDGTALTLIQLEEFHVRVIYESAYGDTFTYDSRSHLR
jgi:hypothetical protein